MSITNITTIGELESKVESRQFFHWKIPKFSSLDAEALHESPPFIFAGKSWHLVMELQKARSTSTIHLFVILRCKTNGCPPCHASGSVILHNPMSEKDIEHNGSLTDKFNFDENLSAVSFHCPLMTVYSKCKGCPRCDASGSVSAHNPISEKDIEHNGSFAGKFNFEGKFTAVTFHFPIMKMYQLILLPSDVLTLVCEMELDLDHLILSETDVLSKNFKNLFIGQECCDAVVKVEDKEFNVHKAVLVARSPVFAAMFRKDTLEKQTSTINVPDCDAETFQQLLEYLYSGRIDITSSDSAIGLYSISDKYNLIELRNLCAKYMMQNLTVQNLCDVAFLADRYDEAELLVAAQRFFNKNAKKIVKTGEWENLLKMDYCLASTFIMEMTESEETD